MTKAFIMLAADRTETGPVRVISGAIQQETRLYQGEQCVCVILVTFPPGSPEADRAAAAQTLDGSPVVRHGSIQSDVPGA